MTEKKVDEVPQLIYDTLKEFGKVTKLIVLADKVGMNTGTLKLYLESDELKDKIHVWTTDNIKWVNIPRGGTTITEVRGDRKPSPTIITICEDCKKEFEQSKMGRRSVRCSDCKEKRRLERLQSRGKTEEVLEGYEVEEEEEIDEGEEEIEDDGEGETGVTHDIVGGGEGDVVGGKEGYVVGEIDEEDEIEVRGITGVEDAQSHLEKLMMGAMAEWIKHRIDEIVVDHIMDQETLEFNALSLVKNFRKLPDEFRDKFDETR